MAAMYEYYMEHRLEGIVLKDIPEVESYMRRHWLEYQFFLDIMAAPQDAEELCMDEGCKRDFLMYKIHQEISNPNIGLVLSGIYEYVEKEALGKYI